MTTEIKRDNYKIKLFDPQIYVDNEKRGRSGHMTHAMAEFKKGCFIDFNSNCSALRYGGHFPYGWVEYRITDDCGKTFSDFKTLDYSYKCFIDGINTISVEKAVACNDGTIVAFCLRNDAMSPQFCEPWATPTVIRSKDGGKSWTEAKELCPYPGRPYDAVYKNGKIYVLHFCNPNFLGTEDKHKYRIFESCDNGESFTELCEVPIDSKGRGYGSMLFDEDDTLHIYTYNSCDESHMDHAVSCDYGKSWELLPPTLVKKGIRNPQTALLNGIFVLHGRTGDRNGFVIYTSENGSDWDEGFLVEHQNFLAGAYYSNNINLEDEHGKFLLIQYSSPYTHLEDLYYVATVNVMHLRLEIEKCRESGRIPE